MGAHAKLSPSGADGWMVCVGKMHMEKGLPDHPSKAADEGTAAHFLASESLIAEVNANVHLGKIIAVGVSADNEDTCTWKLGGVAGIKARNEFEVDQDMVDYIQSYMDYVLNHGEEGEVYVEYALDISHLTGEPEAVGTLDTHIVKPEELVIIDLKYGHTPVSVVGNRQLMIYALAAYNEHSLVQDFKRVRMVIHQPRVFDDPAEFVMEIDELMDFADEVKLAANRVWSVFREEDGSIAEKYLTPGEAQCKFCRAKLQCPAFNKATDALVISQFEEIQEGMEGVPGATMIGQVDHFVKSYTPEQLNSMANCLPLVKQWVKAVEDTRDWYLLEQNGQLADWKVVQGNEGNREWVNVAAAEAELKRMKIKEEHMYNKKLVTAPQAEKLFKAKIIGDRQWPKLQGLITRKPGGKTVVPATDKRPALTHVAEQFEVISDKSESVDDLL
jgi:hypothetical protein